MKYIRNPSFSLDMKIKCPHCNEPSTKNECLCNIANFISAFSHKMKVIQEHIVCETCNYDSTECMKWFKKCKCDSSGNT